MDIGKRHGDMFDLRLSGFLLLLRRPDASQGLSIIFLSRKPPSKNRRPPSPSLDRFRRRPMRVVQQSPPWLPCRREELSPLVRSLPIYWLTSSENTPRLTAPAKDCICCGTQKCLYCTFVPRWSSGHRCSLLLRHPIPRRSPLNLQAS